MSTIARATPADLEKLIERCLRKDPDQRIQHMDDVKLLLAELKEDLDWGRLQTTPGAVRRASPLRISAVVVAVAVLIAAGWCWLVRQGPSEPEAPLTAVPLTSNPGYKYCPSFSPDGTQVAFQWCTEGPEKNCNIYIKQIGFEPRSGLTRDPADDISPAWSPDGRFIAFLRRLSPSRQALMLIPQRGVQEETLGQFDVIDYERSGVSGPYLSWSPGSRLLVLPTGERGNRAMDLLLISVET